MTRFLSRHKQSIRWSVVSAVLAVSLWGVSFRIWQAWSNTYLAPILTTTETGPLQVRAFNAKNEIVAKWVSPQIEPILLPKVDLFLDIVQPGRIGYRHVIHPSDPPNEFNQRPYTTLELATPMTPRWSIADVEWAVPVCLNRESLDNPKSVVVRIEKTICLIDLRNGDKQWQCVEPLGIDWGCTPRGPPSTFQPDRLTSIPDINNDGVDDIVLSHPNLPELLCLSGSDGKELWRSQLFESFAGSPTPDLVKLTPVLLEPIQAMDGINRLVVVVCPKDFGQGELNRWIVSVNATTGKAEWHRPSALSTQKGRNHVVESDMPSWMSWDDFEKNRWFDFCDQDNYFHPGNKEKSGQVVCVGSDRPRYYRFKQSEAILWIDGPHWQSIDPTNGNVVRHKNHVEFASVMPKRIRSGHDRQLILYAFEELGSNCFSGIDPLTGESEWKVTTDAPVDVGTASGITKASDCPFISDLNGDEHDEWLAMVDTNTSMSGREMPTCSLMLHSGSEGKPMWARPVHLPASDGFANRICSIPDIDGDGWREIAIGTRFGGGGVDRVGCFVDLVSGKSGNAIWHHRIQPEVDSLPKIAVDFSSMLSLDENKLIQVRTMTPINFNHWVGGIEYHETLARPSVVYLDVHNGNEVGTGRGLDPLTTTKDSWLELRRELLPLRLNPGSRGLLAKWSYPSRRWTRSPDARPLYGDIDHDGYSESYIHDFEANPTNARSSIQLVDGRTGKTRWATQIRDPSRGHEWIATDHDIDGDGIDEIFQIAHHPKIAATDPNEPSQSFVRLLSGQTGNEIWKTDFPLSAASSPPTLESENRNAKCALFLHDDFRPEQNGRTLYSLDLRSGHVLWQKNNWTKKQSSSYNKSIALTLLTRSSLSPAHPVQYQTRTGESMIALERRDGTDGTRSVSFLDVDTGIELKQHQFEPPDNSRFSPTIQLFEWNGRRWLGLHSKSSKISNVAGVSSISKIVNELWLYDPESLDVGCTWKHELRVGSTRPSPESLYALSMQPNLVQMRDGRPAIGIVVAESDHFSMKCIEFPMQPVQEPLSTTKSCRLPIDYVNGGNFTVFDVDNDGVDEWVIADRNGLSVMREDGPELWRNEGTFPFGTIRFFVEHGVQKLCVANEHTHPKSDVFDAMSGEFLESIEASSLQLSRLALNRREIRVENSEGQSGVQVAPDLRRIRDLPWVQDAQYVKSLVRWTLEKYSWWRIFKLMLGIATIAAMFRWLLIGQLTIRKLLVLATAVAIASAIFVEDLRSVRVETGIHLSTLQALFVAMTCFIGIVSVLLPFAEIIQSRLRRRLAVTVYLVVAGMMAVLRIRNDWHGKIELSYSWSGADDLIWLALLPSGFVLATILIVWFFVTRLLALRVVN